MLSLTCKASIKAVVFLGSRLRSGERSSLKDVAAYTGENEHTVGKLLQRLVKAGIIQSAKGPKGGFFLTAKQAEQRVIRIVEAIDGAEVFTQCGLGMSKCSDVHPCPLHDDYKLIREGFRDLCRRRKVRDLFEEVNSGMAHLLG
jgi:Rrf2 family protein